MPKRATQVGKCAESPDSEWETDSSSCSWDGDDDVPFTNERAKASGGDGMGGVSGGWVEAPMEFKYRVIASARIPAVVRINGQQVRVGPPNPARNKITSPSPLCDVPLPRTLASLVALDPNNKPLADDWARVARQAFRNGGMKGWDRARNSWLNSTPQHPGKFQWEIKRTRLKKPDHLNPDDQSLQQNKVKKAQIIAKELWTMLHRRRLHPNMPSNLRVLLDADAWFYVNEDEFLEELGHLFDDCIGPEESEDDEDGGEGNGGGDDGGRRGGRRLRVASPRSAQSTETDADEAREDEAREDERSHAQTRSRGRRRIIRSASRSGQEQEQEQEQEGLFTFTHVNSRGQRLVGELEIEHVELAKQCRQLEEGEPKVLYNPLCGEPFQYADSDILRMKGCGQCFYRCLAKFKYDNQEEYERIKKELASFVTPSNWAQIVNSDAMARSVVQNVLPKTMKSGDKTIPLPLRLYKELLLGRYAGAAQQRLRKHLLSREEWGEDESATLFMLVNPTVGIMNWVRIDENSKRLNAAFGFMKTNALRDVTKVFELINNGKEHYDVLKTVRYDPLVQQREAAQERERGMDLGWDIEPDGDDGERDNLDLGWNISPSAPVSPSGSTSESRSPSFRLPSSVTQVDEVAGVLPEEEVEAPREWSRDLALRVARYNDSSAPVMALIVAFRSHVIAGRYKKSASTLESSNTFPLSARELSFGCSGDSPLMQRPVKLKTMQHKWRFATHAPGSGGYMVLLKLISKNTTPRRTAGLVLLNMFTYNLLDEFVTPDDVQRATGNVEQLRDLLDMLNAHAPANATAVTLERRLLVEALRQQYNIQHTVNDVRPDDLTSAYSRLLDRFHRHVPFLRRSQFMQFRELPPSMESRSGLLLASAADVAEYNSALQTERGVAELDMQCNALPGLFATNLRAIATIVRGLGVRFLVIPVLMSGDGEESASASASASAPGEGSRAANYEALSGLVRAREVLVSLKLIAYTDDGQDKLFANSQSHYLRVIVMSTSK